MKKQENADYLLFLKDFNKKLSTIISKMMVKSKEITNEDKEFLKQISQEHYKNR